MGNSLFKLEGPTHVVMVGLDSAGKTTVLYRLKYEQYVNTMPTVGFNCEKIKGTLGKAKGVSFIIWDVGGQDKVRQLWRSYTRSTDGIVFVVDSADVERMEEAKMELFRTARAPETAGVPIIVVANKQDLPQALDVSAIEKYLALQDLTSQGPRSVRAMPACAITGEGLEMALEQLYQMIQENRKKKIPKKKR